MGDKNKKVVIGITGTNLSGKDTVAEIIKRDFGFSEHYGFSDEVRIEATQKGLSHERENLQLIGNEIRNIFGPGEFGNRIISKIKGYKTLVTGFRNPAEVEVFRDKAKSGIFDFYLIGVDAPLEIRYKRSQTRGRSGENDKNFEEFKKIDEIEMYGGIKKGLNEMYISDCLKMADYLIINDSTLKSLQEKTESVMKKITF